jgi:predicted ATPase
MYPKPFVITGGPGVGKTTVIEILRKGGYRVTDETAREIIEQEMAKGSDVLPWKDLQEFQVQVFLRQSEKEKSILESLMPVFLDRSIIDGYAYCILGKVTPSPEIVRLAPGRYQKVFLLDRLSGYVTDDSRIEDEQFAKDIHAMIEKVYADFGYEAVHVPVLEPEERVDFILSSLAE